MLLSEFKKKNKPLHKLRRIGSIAKHTAKGIYGGAKVTAGALLAPVAIGGRAGYEYGKRTRFNSQPVLISEFIFRREAHTRKTKSGKTISVVGHIFNRGRKKNSSQLDKNKLAVDLTKLGITTVGGYLATKQLSKRALPVLKNYNSKLTQILNNGVEISEQMKGVKGQTILNNLQETSENMKAASKDLPKHLDTMSESVKTVSKNIDNIDKSTAIGTQALTKNMEILNSNIENSTKGIGDAARSIQRNSDDINNLGKTTATKLKNISTLPRRKLKQTSDILNTDVGYLIRNRKAKPQKSFRLRKRER